MKKGAEKLNKGEIIIYKDKGNKIDLKFSLNEETIWLSQQQMALLFGKNIRTINEHIQNIFKSKELFKKSVIRKFRITAADGKNYDSNFYNLDMVLSVGYRVNSQKATAFRIWATEKLRDYIVKGYVVNQRRLAEKNLKDIRELEQVFISTKNLLQAKQLENDEAAGILKIITDYTNSWVLLQKYDEGSLSVSPKSRKVKSNIDFETAASAIEELKKNLSGRKEAGELFGQRRGEMLKGILGNLCQSFSGKELYPTVGIRAAHLLYFIIKDHPFFDGNKRIGSFLFILFLQRNSYFTKKSGEKKIDENGLVALALLVAQSDSKDKEGIIKLIVNFLGD